MPSPCEKTRPINPGARMARGTSSSTGGVVGHRPHVPSGTLRSTLAPTPNTSRIVLPNFSESYATWKPTGPKLKFPPTTHPKLVSLLDTPGDTFQYLWYRTPGETYGSM